MRKFEYKKADLGGASQPEYVDRLNHHGASGWEYCGETAAEYSVFKREVGIDLSTEKALAMIEKDPHQWSARPCATCEAVTGLVGRSFGCVKVREEKNRSSG